MNYVQMINAWDMSKEKDITTIIVFLVPKSRELLSEKICCCSTEKSEKKDW